MIDERQQDWAIEYLFGELSEEGISQFEAELLRHPELAEWVDEHREILGAIAEFGPIKSPPPSLREKILTRVRPPVEASVATRKIIPFPWFPVALAAGLVLTLTLVGLDDLHLREEKVNLLGNVRELNHQVADLAHQNNLANVKVAALTSQETTLAKANVIVVWDSTRQEGIIKLVDLPKADPGKDYQLWAIDPKYPTPVSAGVLTQDVDGAITISFKPTQPVTSLAKFAISVENTGGAAQPAGPIVFAGN